MNTSFPEKETLCIEKLGSESVDFNSYQRSQTFTQLDFDFVRQLKNSNYTYFFERRTEILDLCGLCLMYT